MTNVQGSGSAQGNGDRTRQTPKGAPVVLTDAMVLTMDDQRRAFANGFVWLEGGRIRGVGPMSELPTVPVDIPRRSLAGHVVMPGLVNCHTHLGNGFLRGIYDEMPLEVWFSKGMWPVLSAMNAEAGEAGALLSGLELLKTGVTTTASGEICSPHRETLDGVAAGIQRVGIRAAVSRIVMDSADDSSGSQYIPPEYRETPAQAADELRRLQRTYATDRLSIGPEALGVLRCTGETVQAMHALAIETGALFTMHVASSQDERDESRRRFGHGSVAELAKLGVLGPRTLLAHTIWLDDGEIANLSEHGTGISHNPVANAYYGAGVARLAEMIEAGVRVGLGVDGASTNNSQNVWETMKMAMLFQKQKLERAGFGGAELALELMTRGGASALHMEHEIGSLEVGKRADVIAIDTQRLPLAPVQTLISNLIYSNDPNAVQEVYVDGELLVSGGRHRTLDVNEVFDRARGALSGVLKATGLDDYLATRSRWRWA
jgi:5-methylthioadenosine/S-adenosylhomocysteine deaminase